MKKQIALMVYPACSLQEVSNTCALFRWYFDSPTVVFGSSLAPVRSEEGIQIQPDKTFADFDPNAYDCLVIPGGSDFREMLADKELLAFVAHWKDYKNLIFAAICGGPLLLSLSGVLDGKRFVNQLYAEMNEMLPFIQQENFVHRPVVEDGNIITAIGSAYADFAIALARKLGYTCSDTAYKVDTAKLTEKDYIYHLDAEGVEICKEVFIDYLPKQ